MKCCVHINDLEIYDYEPFNYNSRSSFNKRRSCVSPFRYDVSNSNCHSIKKEGVTLHILLTHNSMFSMQISTNGYFITCLFSIFLLYVSFKNIISSAIPFMTYFIRFYILFSILAFCYADFWKYKCDCWAISLSPLLLKWME